MQTKFIPNSRFLIAILCIVLSNFYVNAQLSIPPSGTSPTIDFQTTVTGVNEGTFTAMNPPSDPTASGDLNSNAWSITGLSDVSTDYRGSSTGGETSGGVYAFGVAGDIFLGGQLSGSDLTPGTFELTVENNTGMQITSINLSFELWVNNDQERSASIVYAVSTDGGAFVDINSTLTPEASDALGFVEIAVSEDFMLPVPLNNGSSLVVRWTFDDESGSGSRDEIGIDDIILSATGTSNNCSGSAGPPLQVNEGESVTLMATAQDMGTWSADFGTFSSNTDPNAEYTPGPILNDTTVILTWTSSPGSSGCTEAIYTTTVLVRAQIAADFIYDPAILCPRDGVGIPILTNGSTLGVFSFDVVSGGPNLDLDSETGIVDAGNSDEGTYTITNSVTGCGNLIITGVVDGTLFGGEPKAVELYALTDIADLSAYNLEIVNNGNGIMSNGLDLPKISLAAGDFYYVTGDAEAFINFFGFSPDLEDGEVNGNGDDAVVLFCNGSVSDVFGDPDMDGSSEPWVYLDGWAYRNMNEVGNGGAFDDTNWTFSGINALDGVATNAEATNPMPIGTYSNSAPPANTDVSSSFDITIDFDADPGITLACKSELNVTIDPATCFAEITYPMLLQNVDPVPCYNYSIDVEGLSTNLISTPGVYKVSVESGYDGNSCWGMVTVEDKTGPVLTCPLDATIACAIDPTPENVRIFGTTEMDNGFSQSTILNDFTQGPSNAAAWGVEVQECGGFILDFQDRLVDGGCDGDTITRVFTARDETGRTASCSHTIFLQPEDISNITLPDDYDCTELDPADCDDRIETYGTINRVFTLKCDEEGINWSALPSGNPSPDDSLDIAGNLITPGTGRIGGINCGTIDAAFNDIRVPICAIEGTSCEQNEASFKVVRQWKILDWCDGTIIDHNQIIKVVDDEAPVADPFPDVTISTDLWDCGATYNLPLGVATDNCSSEIRRAYRSTAGTIENGVLFIPDNAKTMNGDTVKIEVDFIDCCGNTATEAFNLVIRDLIPPVPVADHHTTVALSQFEANGLAKIYAESFDDGSFDNCGPIDLQVRRMADTLTCMGYEESQDAVLFRDFVHFCCEDVGELIMVEFRVCDDGDMDGVFNTEGDNCNFAMIEVEVQDKLPPACSAPEDLTIDCIDLAALGDLDLLTSTKIDAQFGTANAAATCDVDISQVLSSSEDCGLGTITRTITATNPSNGLTTDCIQIITVTVDSNVNFLTCDDIQFPLGSPEALVFSEAGISDVWCSANPENIGDPVDDGEDLPAIQVMNCTDVDISAPEINIDNLCSEVGINLTLDTFDFAGGGCMKILAHWEIIDQCIFDENFLNGNEIDPFNPENGYFELYVEYDLFDTEGPTIICGEGFTTECDGALLGTLSASASDNCTEPAFFGWSWQFDLEGNGSIDFEGEGNEIIPSDIGREEFPSGEHIVTWIVSDGCGNLSSMDCPLGFDVVDNKPPTPYCLDGLSTAVMEQGGVTLWAADFDAGSFDNCGSVFVTMIPETDAEGLDEDSAYAASLNLVTNPATGEEEYGWTFDCKYIPNSIAGTNDIRIYATDEAGNYDYCVATLRLTDNLQACEEFDGATAIIGGEIQTQHGDMLSGVSVEIMSSIPGYPKMMTTNENGIYESEGGLTGFNYSLTPFKNDDYRNGVTTLDIVLIQKHILNLAPLDGPYNLIAADINGDQSIKATDLLQLRKLILGLYPDNVLPSNRSWRFLGKETTFSDESQPWDFSESLEIFSLSEDMMDQDFTAVKVGDVNGSVQSSNLSEISRRSNFTLNIENQTYKRGEIVEVDFTASENHKLYGLQSALNIDKDLSYLGYTSGELELEDIHLNNLGVSDGILLLSFDNVYGQEIKEGDVLFTLRFKATNDSSIGNALSLNLEEMIPEAYLGESLSTATLTLRNVEKNLHQNTLVVYQNQPNPFKNVTNIDFLLAKKGEVELKVFDVNGRVLLVDKEEYEEGKNSIKISNLNASGILYYQLTSGEESITKKMIVIN